MTQIPRGVGADGSEEQPRGKRLDSWKEIAVYLRRDVATARRWEKREALPVHRHLHEKLGSVFAYTAELDAWGEGRLQHLEQHPPSEAAHTQIEDSPSRIPEGYPALPWVAAGALAIGLALLLMIWAPWQRPPSAASLRLSADLGADVSLASFNVQFGDAAVLSPDGAVVAFVAQRDAGAPQLYVRRLNQLHATPLPGTDDALSPFFSPDGRWIAFFARGKLKKIALTGGAAETLSDALSNRGGAWGEDGTIVFSPDQAPGTRLLRISSVGGKAEPVAELSEGEVIQAWPQVLPGGKAVLYTGSGIAGAYDNADLVVQPLPKGTRKVVQRGGYHGRYLPSGHLLYVHKGTLFAAPFDLARLEVRGQPVPVVEGVSSNSLTGGAQFASSSTGMLLYLPGRSTGAGNPIDWIDHKGKTAPLRLTPANWSTPRFAPDGRRLAMEIRDESSSDIWIYEWARDTLTNLTSDPIPDQRPVWTPDGQRITFSSQRPDKLAANLYWQSADGTGNAQRLTESKNHQQPSSWHPSGKFLAFEETTAQTKVDVMIMPVEGDEASGWKPGRPKAFLNGPYVEFDPTFSPDGRWLAYASVESGHPEVYVRPFPGPGGRWLIGAGGNPIWSPTKRELFYGVNGQIMVAAFTVDGDSFHPEKSRLWFEGRYQVRGSTRMFDLHRDGERFALAPAAQTPSGAKQDKLVFVLNFFDELRRITPAVQR